MKRVNIWESFSHIKRLPAAFVVASLHYDGMTTKTMTMMEWLRSAPVPAWKLSTESSKAALCIKLRGRNVQIYEILSESTICVQKLFEECTKSAFFKIRKLGKNVGYMWHYHLGI